MLHEDFFICTEDYLFESKYLEDRIANVYGLYKSERDDFTTVNIENL